MNTPSIPSNNIRFDRNIVYNVENVIPAEVNFEMAIEVVYYIAALCQKNQNTLFSQDSIFTEFPITAKDFMKFSSRSKANVYKDSGWKKTIPIIYPNGATEEITLNTVFEKILWELSNHEIPFAQVYEVQMKKGTSKRAVLNNKFLKLSVEVGKSFKTKEKVYYVQVNEFFAKSLLDQFVVVNTKDFIGIRGNRERSIVRIFLALLNLENEYRYKKLPEIKLNYSDVKRISGIQINSEDESSNISKTVKKFAKYLDKINQETVLKFNYLIKNNNFHLQFTNISRIIPVEFNRNIWVLNVRNEIENYLVEIKRNSINYELLDKSEKLEISKHVLLKFLSQNIDKGVADFLAKRKMISPILAYLLFLDVFEVENLLDYQDLR